MQQDPITGFHAGHPSAHFQDTADAFRTGSAALLHHDALIIGRGPTVAQELGRIAPHFASMTPLEGFTVGRGDKAEIALTVIQAHDLITPYPLPSWAASR